MIAIVDEEPIGIEMLQDTIDEVEPSADKSVPEISGIQTLATNADQRKLSEGAVEETIDEIHRLLKHDRASVHRLAAVAGTVLVDIEPGATEQLLDRLVSMLNETVTERRAMETIEYVSTAAPDAVGDRLSIIVEYLDHPRDGVARHAGGALLSVSVQTPDSVIEFLPRLLASLTDSFEPVTGISRSTHGGHLQSLEHERRLEYASSRLIVARSIAALAESRPEAAAKAVVESGTVDALESLFDDPQPRVRAAAVGIASYVAELEPKSIEPAMDRLIERLNDDHEIVRASAIWALRALDHPQAIEPLRAVRRNDPSEELCNLAATTIQSSDSMGTKTDINNDRESHT